MACRELLCLNYVSDPITGGRTVSGGYVNPETIYTWLCNARGAVERSVPCGMEVSKTEIVGPTSSRTSGVCEDVSMVTQPMASQRIDELKRLWGPAQDELCQHYF